MRRRQQPRSSNPPEAIEGRLGIQTCTVQPQIERMYRELDVHTRLGLGKRVFREYLKIIREQQDDKQR